MTSEAAAHEELLWAKVETALKTAKGMYFDGWNKIYLAADDTANEMFIDKGWSGASLPDLDLIHTWFDQSCGPRFISTVTGEDAFESLIPHFELS